MAFFTAMDIYLISLLVEPIKQELALTDVEVGLANSSTLYLAYAVFCVPAGILVDRANRVRMLAGAILLWCLGLVLTGLSSGIALLAGSKLVLGLANAISLPAAMSLLADHFAPGRRAMATASYGIGQGMGQAGAIFVGGLGLGALTDYAGSHPDALFGLAPWRVVSLAFAAGGLLLLPLLLTLREPARMERREEGARFGELWDYRTFLGPLLAGTMCLSGMSTAILSWIPPALTRLYGQQPGEFAGWFGLVSLTAGIAGLLGGGLLVRATYRRGGDGRLMRPAAIGALLCAPASCVALTPDAGWFAATTALFIIAYAIAISIPVIAITFRIPNELRGLAMGLYVVTVALAGAVSGPLVAVASGLLGGEAMLGWGMALVGAPFALLAAAAFASISRPSPAPAA